MSVRPELAVLIRQWVQKAENDFLNAQHTMLMEESCPYDTVCFHCQQCVEKHLKAILVLNQTPFQKTHDLEQLRLLMPETISLPVTVAELARLSPHATNSRYPDDWRSPERQEAEWALGVAARVRTAVREYLAAAGLA
ncbi:MAG: HEPN domain-containing protein [Bryobacteraceae bacterium]|jgi:HEPN domain-containing protein